MALKMTTIKKEEVREFQNFRELGEGGGTLEDNMDALKAVLELLTNEKPGAAAAELFALIEPWYFEKDAVSIREHIDLALAVEGDGQGADGEEGVDGVADDALDG